NAGSNAGSNAGGGRASPVGRDGGIGGGELALDVDGRASLLEQCLVQGAHVGALAVVLGKRGQGRGRSAEPASHRLHRRGGGGLALGRGARRQRLEHLHAAPEAVGEPVAVEGQLIGIENVGAVLLQPHRRGRAPAGQRTGERNAGTLQAA